MITEDIVNIKKIIEFSNKPEIEQLRQVKTDPESALEMIWYLIGFSGIEKR